MTILNSDASCAPTSTPACAGANVQRRPESTLNKLTCGMPDTQRENSTSGRRDWQRKKVMVALTGSQRRSYER
jgi:hypothetical protein